MNKKSAPWIISSVLVVVLVVGGVWYYKAKSASAAPSNFITGNVKYGNVKETVNATGTVELPTQYNLNFNGTSKGKVTEVDVKVGDSVKSGQVLAKIDQTSVQQSITQAQIGLTQAELKLQQLKAPPSQVDELRAQNAVKQDQANLTNSQTTLQELQKNKNADPAAVTQAQNSYNNAQASLAIDKAQLAALNAGPNSTDLQLAELQVTQAQSALTQAKDGINDTVITAPADGTIVAVNGQVGEYPSGGSSSGSGGGNNASSASSASSAFIVLNGDSSTMQIVVPVDEADIANVKVDQSVDLTLDAYPDKTFTGSVTQVAPTGNSQSGVTTFSVTVSADNSSGLMKSGMSANVSIILAQKQNVLTVPSMAVHDNNGSDTVMLAPTDGSNRPQSVPVTIGVDDGNNAQVVQGLQEGDKVIIGFRPTTSSSASGGLLGGRSTGGFGGMGGFGGGNFGGGRGSYGGGGNRGNAGAGGRTGN